MATQKRFGLTGQLSAFWAFHHGSSAQCEGDVCFLLHFAAGVHIGAEPLPGRVHIQSGRTHLIAGQLSGGGRYREHWRNHQIAWWRFQLVASWIGDPIAELGLLGWL